MSHQQQENQRERERSYSNGFRVDNIERRMRKVWFTHAHNVVPAVLELNCYMD